MNTEPEELSALVVRHLVEIVGGECSITDEAILNNTSEGNQAVGEILAGLLFLHQDLVHRESERARAEFELTAAVEQLSSQNRELEESRKRLAILAAELSTPVISVWESVIMVPILGNIDADRAAEITERLLTAIVAEKAAWAIIDITGVQTIDTETADYFIRMIRSIRLLGARAIVAGASAALAVTIVTLGVDVEDIHTVRNLQQALVLAMTERRTPTGNAPRQRAR